jgi:MscS family membrane protein
VNWKTFFGVRKTSEPGSTSVELTEKMPIRAGAIRSSRFGSRSGLSIRRFSFLDFLLLAPIALVSASVAQVQSTEAAKTVAAVPAGDLLGRDTPRGTVLGFLAAVRRGDYDAARRFLAPPSKGAVNSELADQLAYVVNAGQLGRISDQQEGSAQPGLSRGIERIGVVSAEDRTFNLDLSRTGEDGHWIWVFSSATLAETPAAYESLNAASINRHLPRFLARPMWLFVPLWKNAALVGSLLAAIGCIYAIRPFLRRSISRAFAKESASDRVRLAERLVRPLGMLIWLFMTQGLVLAFQLPLLARERWYLIISRAGIAVVAWLLLAVVNVTALAYRLRTDRSDRSEMTAVVRLAQRTVSFLCVFAGLLVFLRLAGYDISAFVAGLGVGGFALAFAAQKTLENVFGGVSIILDKPIRVGDECRVGDTVGTVIDIGLRSTRLRTAERTIMTVPNGQLSTMTLDNLSMRDSIRFYHVLRIGTDIGPAGLEEIINALRALLIEEQGVDPASCRIRLIRVDAQSAEVELLCLVRTRILAEFLSVQEDLLLKCLRAIDAQGASLALPSSIVHLSEAKPAESGRQGPSD